MMPDQQNTLHEWATCKKKAVEVFKEFNTVI